MLFKIEWTKLVEPRAVTKMVEPHAVAKLLSRMAYGFVGTNSAVNQMDLIGGTTCCCQMVEPHAVTKSLSHMSMSLLKNDAEI